MTYTERDIRTLTKSRILCQWDSPQQRCIIATFCDNWRSDDLVKHLDEANTLLDSVDHVVHYVAEFRTRKTPTGLLTLIPELGRHSFFSNPNLGLIVNVNAGDMIRALGDIFEKYHFPLNRHYFHSMDDVCELLEVVADG